MRECVFELTKASPLCSCAKELFVSHALSFSTLSLSLSLLSLSALSFCSLSLLSLSALFLYFLSLSTLSLFLLSLSLSFFSLSTLSCFLSISSHFCSLALISLLQLYSMNSRSFILKKRRVDYDFIQSLIMLYSFLFLSN